MKKLYTVLFLSLILISSCGDDEKKGPSASHEFSTYLVDEILIKDYVYDETGDSFEIGWVFDSEDGGKVTELGGLFPEAGTYTVTLWDAATEAILGQAEVTAVAGKLVMKKIDTVVIEAGKDYVISYNSYDGRDYYWLNPGVSIYPVELDGITVYGEVETSTDSDDSEFPRTSLSGTVVGVPEIGFIKN